MVDDTAIECTYLHRNKGLTVLKVKEKEKPKDWRNDIKHFIETNVSTNTSILNNKKNQTRTTPVRVRY